MALQSKLSCQIFGEDRIIMDQNDACGHSLLASPVTRLGLLILSRMTNGEPETFVNIWGNEGGAGFTTIEWHRPQCAASVRAV
jgi:hypothetical protein